MPLREELMEIRDPVLRKVRDHPFWSGLRDGSLPGEALARFVEQDTGFLLPAYARALARCAAAAPDSADTLLLGRSIVGTLTSRAEMRRRYADMAREEGLPGLDEQADVEPATHAHASFFAAAGTMSFHAGIGALLPMAWFHADVSDDLRDNVAAGSRYEPWSRIYHPGETFRPAVQELVDMTGRAGEAAAEPQRRALVEQFLLGARYEWAFAESCLRRSPWPV
ncbi:TenA family protein [Actinomadura sp. 9N407]|uniref:TenA family protein n=1 Tax=Actinomadura sp. 9N407 TaxID=3375154 RepID=UPI003791B324